MSKLRERTVQDKALNELKSYYCKREGIDAIYACAEARTKKENGSKRADGLLSFKTTQGHCYTVSMEAKSHRTLGALTTFVNADKLGWQSLLAALATTALACFCLSSYFDMRWYFLVLSAVLIFLTTIIATFALLDLLDFDSHKQSSVVNQLKQYPANEQWVVFSRYADNLLATVPAKGKKNHLQVLDSLCQQNGFGLMLISNQKTEIVVEPKAKKGNFLNHYCKEQEVMLSLDRFISESATQKV